MAMRKEGKRRRRSYSSITNGRLARVTLQTPSQQPLPSSPGRLCVQTWVYCTVTHSVDWTVAIFSFHSRVVLLDFSICLISRFI